MLLQILRSSLFPGKPSTPGQVSCFPAPLLTLLCFLRQALLLLKACSGQAKAEKDGNQGHMHATCM